MKKPNFKISPLVELEMELAQQGFGPSELIKIENAMKTRNLLLHRQGPKRTEMENIILPLVAIGSSIYAILMTLLR
jgi:hypothetical protein